MRLNKANIAGLTSPRQQSEMKCILAGTWPPLKPLPIFKYEAAEYRATIDFDKKRGEWVCRKTSLPSNEVQELRGGLREITLALPHGEEEMVIEGAEQQEQELEKDANRRLQAIHDWREKYENGARYFELRDFLSEGQRTELDDSLRLSLTARQLQFNAKNVANVFDDLSIAGGRFATLIEFAKRNKAKQGTAPQTQGEGFVTEAERAIDHDEQFLGAGSREFGPVLNSDNPFVRDQEVAEGCTDAEEFPALSIKNVFSEPDQASMAEQMEHTASQQFEIETLEILDRTPLSLVEDLHDKVHHHTPIARFVPQARTDKVESSGDPIKDSPSHLYVLEISGFQIFALVILCAVINLAVGLTVGRSPVGRRLREAPKSLLATDAKPPTLPDQADESTSRPSIVPAPNTFNTPAVNAPAPRTEQSSSEGPFAQSLNLRPEDSASPARPTGPSSAATTRALVYSDNPLGANKLGDVTPSEQKSKESTQDSESFSKVPSTDSNSSATAESKPFAKPEVNSERSSAIGPIVRNVSPPASSRLAHSRKAIRRISSEARSRARYKLTSTMGAAPQLPRPSTALVTVPDRGSQPFRVSFPKKTIAATSSFAMTSQLSVLVSPEPGPTVAHKSARLEAGDLVSFVWPRYPSSGYRHGLAETIRVRATIGQLGQVLEVKFLSGSVSLLPATTGAIRQWRYRPTLLDKRPVQTEQDVTIEFRPPQYSSQVSTQHPFHN